LDAGELELMLDSASNKDELMATLSEDIEGKEKTIRCPICSKKLFKVRYGTDKTLLLDKCPRNDGLWFDKGELCDALEMGNFKRGQPIYNVLNDIFGGKCRNGER
jgi:Zn-finger nucleic acid-binding protein